MKIAILVALTIINLYFSIDLSAGDRYVSRLNKWYELALANNWEQANKLEKDLDLADLKWFKDKYRPEDIKKQLNELMVKGNKSADDWMYIAQIQSRINLEEMKRAIEMAHQIDPIRADIEKVYFFKFID